MIVNFENDKKALEEQAERNVEVNKGLLNEIAQKKAEIENIENYIIALQDLMSEAYVQKEVLEKYDDVVSEMNGILEREIFIYAFRLGGRFMVETLSKDE